MEHTQPTRLTREVVSRVIHAMNLISKLAAFYHSNVEAYPNIVVIFNIHMKTTVDPEDTER